MPDLASTLITQAEQDAEDDNLRFLRGEISTQNENGSDENDWSRSEGSRISDIPGTQHRYTPSQREFNELEERAPQIVQQEYSGWAPGISDGEDEDSQTNASRTAPAAVENHLLRNENSLRDRMRIRRLRDHFVTQMAEPTTRHQEYATSPLRHPSRFVENGVASYSSMESSLRTTAMMQAVRQNTQMSPHPRSQLQRYILDRENMGSDAENSHIQRPNLSSSDISPSQRRQLYQEHVIRQEIQQNRDLLAEHQQHRYYLEDQLRQQQQRFGPLPSTESRRRRMWHNSSPQCPTPNTLSVENTVRYLQSLRLCESDKEGLEAADDSGFDPNELCPHNSDDFLLDTKTIPLPPSSSWLTIGSVLSGTQHAISAPLNSNSAGRFALETRSRVRHPTFGISSVRATSPVRSSNNNAQVVLPPNPNESIQNQESEEDRWPVKVTIHDADHDEMTVSGMMEAFNVPDRSSPTKTSSITTYLEGEIIDFNKFTLETKSFRADPRVDGTYWRKLPPFKDMKDEATVVKRLLSKDWLERELMPNWVLMRWKGSSFCV